MFLTIGEKLKNAREEKGVDLKEVQEYTKIRKKYLEALENDKFELIPGEAYIRAFIKGYANFLGLEYMELHQQYNELQEENDENENIENHKDKENNLLHNKTLIAAIFVIVILLVLVFFYINVQLLNNSKGEIDAFTTNANSNNISSQDYNNS
ncbi:MAG: helix-turn-helix domain-containing protein, partial [Halanaerobiaceae bacterium]